MVRREGDCTVGHKEVGGRLGIDVLWRQRAREPDVALAAARDRIPVEIGLELSKTSANKGYRLCAIGYIVGVVGDHKRRLRGAHSLRTEGHGNGALRCRCQGAEAIIDEGKVGSLSSGNLDAGNVQDTGTDIRKRNRLWRCRLAAPLLALRLS